MIKLLNLSADKQKKIVDWLSDEIGSVLKSRGDLEAQWILWNKQFEAKPDSDVKNFPFERASNIVAPVQSTIVNTFVAREYNTLFGVRPLWTVRAQSKQWTDHALPTQQLLEFSQRRELKFPVNCIEWLYDIANMGTGFIKLPWVIETKKGKQYDGEGNIVPYEYSVSDGPRFIPIPIKDLIFPPDSIQDLQLTPWLAHRFRLRYPTLLAREKAGIYINIEKISKYFTEQADRLTEEQERIEYLMRMENIEEYELFEVWCDYDYDNDGVQEACVLTISIDGSALIRPILNPYSHHLRPFDRATLFPRAHRIYGIGYGQKLQRLQEAMTTAVNQAIDNNTISNTKCFKAKRGKGIKPNQKLYTGKFFMLDDLNDLDVFDLGTLNPHITTIVNFLQNFIERDSAVSDYNMGRESSVVGSGATATSTLALIQEGTKIFDFLLNNIRNPLTRVAYMLQSMYAQFKPTGVTFPLLGEEDAALVEQTWTVPPSSVGCLQFDLTASSAYVNETVERESWRMLFDLVVGFYSKIVEVSQIVFDPAAPPQLKMLLGKMAASGQLIMERLLGHWNNKDADRLIISKEEIAQMINAGVTNPSPPPGPSPEEQMELERQKMQMQMDREKGGMELEKMKMENMGKVVELITPKQQGNGGAGGNK